MDKLSSHPITDEYGAVYGVEPPSRSLIADRVNDLIECINASEYKSGYLVSKFGRIKINL